MNEINFLFLFLTSFFINSIIISDSTINNIKKDKSYIISNL